MIVGRLGVGEGESAVDLERLAAGVAAVGPDEGVVDALGLEPGEQEVPQPRKYDRIEVTADDVDRGGVRLTHLTTSLYGVQLPLSDAIGGRVQSIPVDRLTGEAVVGYVDLKSGSGMLVFTPAGDRVKVAGSITVLGQDLSASAVSKLSLDGNDLVLTPQSVSAAGQSSSLIGDAVKGAFRVRVPIGRLPYGLKLTGVPATPGGVVVSARSGPTVLTSR